MMGDTSRKSVLVNAFSGFEGSAFFARYSPDGLRRQNCAAQ
jgi:hypothetical protein